MEGWNGFPRVCLPPQKKRMKIMHTETKYLAVHLIFLDFCKYGLYAIFYTSKAILSHVLAVLLHC